MASFSKTDKGYRAQIKILGVHVSYAARGQGVAAQREREIRDAATLPLDE